MLRSWIPSATTCGEGRPPLHGARCAQPRGVPLDYPYPAERQNWRHHAILVFSNAALQWLPDHARMFPQLMGQVAPGGVLAAQMPAHHMSPLHRVTLDVANDPAWRDRLAAAVGRSLTRESPAFYYDVLQRLAARIDLWETEYYHLVDGPQAIVDWYRGTGLRPFLEALESAEQRQRFEKMILEGYARAYPRQRDGRVLFPYRRLFIVAHRPA